jgi:hypothetical protein
LPLVVLVEHRVAFHPQEDARVKQRPTRGSQIRLVKSVQELVGHLDDVDIPRVDSAVLGHRDEHLDRFDLLAVLILGWLVYPVVLRDGLLVRLFATVGFSRASVTVLSGILAVEQPRGLRGRFAFLVAGDI